VADPAKRVDQPPGFGEVHCRGKHGEAGARERFFYRGGTRGDQRHAALPLSGQMDQPGGPGDRDRGHAGGESDAPVGIGDVGDTKEEDASGLGAGQRLQKDESSGIVSSGGRFQHAPDL
jgi:hypothetical protein